MPAFPSLLEVVPAHPGLEIVLNRLIPVQPVQALQQVFDLRLQRLIEGQEILLGGPAEVEGVEIEKAPQFVDRAVRMVDAKIKPAVIVTAVPTARPNYEEGSGFHPSLLTTGLLPGDKGVKQP
jgi:hypothetical protein